MSTLPLFALALAGLPAGTFALNLLAFRRPEELPAGLQPSVSVLIPARDEEGSIDAAIRSVLAAAEGVDIELIVLDDHSTDRTPEIVDAWSLRDPRVRREAAPPLPPGWCGKQHACFVLAGLARHPRLVFMDADVRLEPRALARMVAFQLASGTDLVSGFPRQIVHSWLERLLIPQILFVLLGFLPLVAMRLSRDAAFGAGCGQLLLTTRSSYQRVGGHAVIRSSLHDGVKLPRAWRRAGLSTDLFDATDIARCRMYGSAGQVWSGLAKNATEGMAANATILPFTLLLLGGQVLPFVLLLAAPLLSPVDLVLVALAVMLVIVPRVIAAMRFRQPLDGALLQPLAIVLLVAIQWWARVRAWMGRRESWRGRAYPAVGMNG